jgi:hypothetical protein
MGHEFKTGQEEELNKDSILRALGLIRAESEDLYCLPPETQPMEESGAVQDLQADSRPERFLQYFERIPALEADPICRPEGDATFFTSAGIQKIDYLQRQEGALKKGQFKVLQPCVRSQYMDRVCEGTSTAFVDFAVVSLRASAREYGDIAKEFILFLKNEGIGSSDLRFQVDVSDDLWGRKKLKKTTLTIIVRGVEVGEVVYVHDYPVSEKESIALVDACIGVERFQWASGQVPHYFPGFDAIYQVGKDLQHSPDEIAAVIDCIRTSVLLAGEGVQSAHKDPGYRLRQFMKRYMERNKEIRLDVKTLIQTAITYWQRWGFRPTVREEEIVKTIMMEHDRSYNVWLVKSVKDKGGPNIQVDVNVTTEAFLAKIKATFPKQLQEKIFAIIDSLT